MKKENKSEVIAIALMQEIQYCNGMVNRNEPEKYPQKWVDKIADKAGPFFENYPHLLDDENIQQICDGEEGENQDRYGNLKGYADLDAVLNDYFNEGGE